MVLDLSAAEDDVGFVRETTASRDDLLVVSVWREPADGGAMMDVIPS